MRQLLLCVCLFLCASSKLSAGTISGYITDSTQAPLPYCNVYLKQTTFAVPANSEGFYQLTVPNGHYIIVFQFIGYQKQEIEIEISEKPTILNVVLKEEITELLQVVINADQEDPAYRVIKQAIELRDNHLREINTYRCDVYMKGFQKLREAPDQIMGIKLNTVLDVDSNNSGIIYLSESVSNFYYAYPDKTKEIMKASVVSGDASQFSWNDAAGMQMNFYENLETLEGFSQRGFVSPIADNALFFYDYHLLSYHFENQHEIFKIQVTPKRAGDPAYTGIIYITDDGYRISGLQLTLTKSNGIEFIDTFHVEQDFYYADPEHLMVLSNKFSFSYGIFGIKGDGFFHAYYSNYLINPIFDKNFFGGEVVHIESNANKQDSVYWSKVRPMQLTVEEQTDYQKKDSLARVKETPAYQDSIDRIFNKIAVADMITGYDWRDSKRDIMFSTNPLPELLQFNTVESYVIQPRITFKHYYEDKRRLEIASTVRYNTASNGVLLSGSIRYVKKPITKSYLFLSGGSRVYQTNSDGISPLVNSLYTLLLEQNTLKLMGQDYIYAEMEDEYANGFFSGMSILYANRYRLYDDPNATPWIDDTDTYFNLNNSFLTQQGEITESGPMSDIFKIQLQFRYVIKQTYIMHPDEKYYNEPKYPVITLKYASAYTLMAEEKQSINDLRFSIFDRLGLNLAGNLEYMFTGSLQFADAPVLMADRLHAIGNETNISRLQNETFYLLPYYYASSERYMSTGHISWHTEGFLFRKLPLFKQLKMEPVFSAHVLTSDTYKFYSEFTVGVEHLFQIVRVDLAMTPYRDDVVPPLRLFIGFGF